MMVLFLTACFWLGTAVLTYTFFVYPLAIAVVAKWRRHTVVVDRETPNGVSIVISVRDEEATIARRLDELATFIAGLAVPGEVIVVSDGSTDATASIAFDFAERGVEVVVLEQPHGKSVALNHGVGRAKYDAVVFADARQRWSANALEHLLASLSNSTVGAVSGDLVLESQPGVLAGVGMYWRFEKWLRHQESLVHSQIGVTGAISAVRRELFRPIPAGIILDDVYWPMQVVLRGRRVVAEPLALAYDRLPERSGDELRRKLRTLVGNFQLIATCPGLLLPWRNPVWLQFLSHKVARLVTPWAMLLMLATSALLPHPLYRFLFAMQLVGVTTGVVGICSHFGSQRRFFAAAGSFLLLHVAAWLAFWFWILGREDRLWRKSSFHSLDKTAQP